MSNSVKKEGTMSAANAAKTERLINLTIGLLAARRYLTKKEIFEKIKGYEGSAATKERMFERDKDELRQMGIELEFIGDDPLFEDEAGYRISPARFQFDSKKFSSQELLMMNQAIALWKATVMSDVAQSGLRRLASTGIPVRNEFIGITDVDFQLDDPLLPQLWRAVAARKIVEFIYSGKNRKVEPYGILLHKGFWYLIANEASQIKRFKLARFESVVNLSSKENEFRIPKDFQVDDYGFSKGTPVEERQKAILKIETGKAIPITKNGKVLKSGKNFDEWEIYFEDETFFKQEILWYADVVEVLEPKILKDSVIASLKHLAKL
jgi:proteasome accessory factor B